MESIITELEILYDRHVKSILNLVHFNGVSSSETVDPHFLHVYQKENWDCGVACCAMVCKWLNIPVDRLYDHDIAAKKCPLWTIDLFLFLTDESVDARMYTVTMGIADHHNDFDWYRDNINIENKTVHNDINEKYIVAIQRGLQLHQKSLSCDEIKAMLCGNGSSIAIVLINALTLYGKQGFNRDSTFSGHYIVLLSYDINENMFLYLNPDRSAEIQKVDEDTFELARKHPATDEDIIFCYK